ncbi:segregation and condensation protein B [Pseudoxanthomonas japonensis]|uniref:SMC-Scp complex subunit ScpB n=1 Tax=Pseudoxanthomonas japonensis TaxID=69284 RepID=UPI00285C044B|nr:SMC-Scp complex subunit ScpB [Pseudoxanthomonas japonensis]MDR7070707.1 segregation and condensation protein B [Pseudoxanthomonas japonensis]
MDQSLINRIVEAALMAATQPLTLAQLHGLFPEDEPEPEGSVEDAVQQLTDACTDRGVELVEVASGYRYQVKADVHAWVARLWTERKTKYTRATLETLALIAYRQPITRGEIEQVRGVAVSSNIIQALEEREWIRVVGHRDVPGKPALFGTTKGFLDYFGLKRLDELPPLSELKDIGELEPQLPLDGAPLPVSIASGDAVDDARDESTQDESTDAADDGDDTDDEQQNTPASDDADEDTASDDTGDDAGDHDEPQPEDDDAAASNEEDRAPSEQKQ